MLAECSLLLAADLAGSRASPTGFCLPRTAFRLPPHLSRSIFALSIHADYRCRHSGACCTAGWRIPVDAPGERLLASAAGEGHLPHVELDRDERIAVLPLTESGACVFYRAESASSWDSASAGSAAAAQRSNPAKAGSQRRSGDADPEFADGRCAVQQALGHEALPLACRQFPRVSLTDPRGTFVTLSHFCPTAAAQLFRNDVPLEIIENAPAFPSNAELVGLDARDALPPLLRPDMLCDHDGFAAWEACGVELFANDAWSPEEAVDRLACATERIRDWRPADGALTDRVRRSFADENGRGPTEAADRYRCDSYLPLIDESLPAGFHRRRRVPDHASIDARLIAPVWPGFAGPVRRYLASRLFGSWLAYQGSGLRTIARSLEATLWLLRLECVRACAAKGRPLDRELVIDAIRQTDLLMVHEVDGLSFARRLSVVETDRR